MNEKYDYDIEQSEDKKGNAIFMIIISVFAFFPTCFAVIALKNHDYFSAIYGFIAALAIFLYPLCSIVKCQSLLPIAIVLMVLALLLTGVLHLNGSDTFDKALANNETGIVQEDVEEINKETKIIQENQGESPAFCPNCGNKVDATDNYCTGCGNLLKKE